MFLESSQQMLLLAIKNDQKLPSTKKIVIASDLKKYQSPSEKA
jgi:hypothetical protein